MGHDTIVGGFAATPRVDDAELAVPTTLPTRPDDTGLPIALEEMLVERIDAAFVPQASSTGVVPWSGTFDELEAELRRDGGVVRGKDGRGVCMSAFVVGEGRTPTTIGRTGRFRQEHLITATKLLGLDFDSRPGDPNSIVAAFRGCDAILYSTHSHGRIDYCREDAKKKLKKEVVDDEVEALARASRFRLLLRLSRPATPDEYRRLWLWADTICGGGSDASCKDPTRLYYTPRVKAHDAEYEPFIFRWRGEALNPDALPDGRRVADLPHPDDVRKGRIEAVGDEVERKSAVSASEAAAVFAGLDDETKRRVGEAARVSVTRTIERLREPKKLDSRRKHLYVCGCRIGEHSGFSDDVKKFVDEFVALTLRTAVATGVPDASDHERQVRNGVHKGQQDHESIEKFVTKTSFRQRLTAFLDNRIAVQRTLDGGEEPTQKPTIKCDADLPGMVSQVLSLLEHSPNVYQRNGSLVMLSTAPPSSPYERRRVDRSAESMSIRGITEGYARELLCELANWTKPKPVKEKPSTKSKKGEAATTTSGGSVAHDQAPGDTEPREKWTDVDVLPPIEVVRAVLAPRPHLGNVRVLTGFVESPCIRPDGSLLTAPGYDEITGLFHHKSIDVTVPDTPTREDALGAVKTLLSVVEDFPFEEEHHVSAWLAAVLTSVARHAIDGCVPLFMFEAPQKGSGKSLCARTVSWLVTGREPNLTVWTTNDEEFRKRMLATGRGGDPLILLDNISGHFGGPTLEAILTNNGKFQDRVLGTNYNESVSITATWMATGNNVLLAGDMDRRIMPIRLDPKCPSPETRTNFKKPDLRGYIREHRAQLVSAALTIIRAYICAGKPPQKSEAWGGYEDWCRLIVGTVVWAGLPDPGLGRDELRKHDPKVQALDDFLCLLPVMDPKNHGLRSSQIVAWCADVPPALSEEARPGAALVAAHAKILEKKPHQVKQQLVAALEVLGVRDVSNARGVGEVLRRIRGQTRPFENDTHRGMHRLVGDTQDRNGVTLWKREVLDEKPIAPEETARP